MGSRISGLAADDEHHLVFWGNAENGSAIGGVVQANYSGFTNSTVVLNNLDVINALDFEDD